jgi:L-fucose mutarotase/ribose pyranase (RbsD/FucU family)
MPILEILSMRNEFIDKLRAIFGGQDVHLADGTFPFRTQVPLLLGVSAVATFTRVERIDPVVGIDDSIFAIPAADFNEVV